MQVSMWARLDVENKHMNIKEIRCLNLGIKVGSKVYKPWYAGIQKKPWNACMKGVETLVCMYARCRNIGV